MSGIAVHTVLVMIALAVAASAQTDPTAEIRATAVPYGHGPDVSADHRVTFRVRAPLAKQVIVGGMEDAFVPPLQLHNDGSGNWSVTSPPLPPDIYT